jgi:hypothetical protein
MRNYLFPFAIILIALIVGANTCEKETDDFEESCDLSERPLINRSFVVTVEVQYSDSVPYQGNVDLKLFKEYCNGSISGNFHKIGNTNSQGKWLCNEQFVFKYENDYDKVDVTVKVANNETSEEVRINDVYNYSDVEGLFFEVYKFYDITLPWSSK